MALIAKKRSFVPESGIGWRLVLSTISKYKLAGRRPQQRLTEAELLTSLDMQIKDVDFLRHAGCNDVEAFFKRIGPACREFERALLAFTERYGTKAICFLTRMETRTQGSLVVTIRRAMRNKLKVN